MLFLKMELLSFILKKIMLALYKDIMGKHVCYIRFYSERTIRKRVFILLLLLLLQNKIPRRNWFFKHIKIESQAFC